MSGLFCASLAAYIPNVTFSRISVTSYSKSSQRGARTTEVESKTQNPTYFLYYTGLRSSNNTCNSVLSQIFDTARNLSDQYTDNSSFFFIVVRSGIDQEETKLRLKKAVCMILRFWFIMKII